MGRMPNPYDFMSRPVMPAYESLEFYEAKRKLQERLRHEEFEAAQAAIDSVIDQECLPCLNSTTRQS